MKQTLILLLSVLLCYNCGDNNSTSKRNRAATQPIGADKKEEKPKAEKTLSFENFHAFTVGNGVRVRAEDNAKSEKVTELKNGTLLTIVGETERRTLSTKTECDRNGYSWFNVVTSGGHKGWIFGKYVYKIEKRGKSGISSYVGATYKFNDEPYIFGVGKDQSMPMTDEVGLTGCDDYLLPFFYKEGEATITAINAKDHEKTTYQLAKNANNYWELTASDGRVDKINSILQILYGVRLNFSVDYQEGSGSGEIDVIMRNNRFYAKIKSYKEANPIQ